MCFLFFTGSKGGVLALLEQHFGRNLNWIVCLLHCNELPLRHLLAKKDGKPKGPSAFPGPIGNSFKNCESRPIVSFQRIEADDILMDFDNLELSTDQKYLGQMHQAIQNGSVSDSLARRDPGNVSLARWLTIANRIMRVYVSTSVPSDALKSLVEYIMKVYVPTWFDIKRDWAVEYGPKHLHNMIVRTRTLGDENSRSIVFERIQRNGFFFHPENLPLAMICDDSPIIRKLGWKRIQKARMISKNNSSRKDKHIKNVRLFQIPKINFQAQTYYQAINWQGSSDAVAYDSPPMLKNLSSEEVDAWATEESPEKYPLLKIPCHSQAVERHVKLVSDASLKTSSVKERDGMIRATKHSREKIPRFGSKKDYVV